ncbi:MAG: hypothetical protein WC708_12380 [Lentisphaeria bacterium]
MPAPARGGRDVLGCNIPCRGGPGFGQRPAESLAASLSTGNMLEKSGGIQPTAGQFPVAASSPRFWGRNRHEIILLCYCGSTPSWHVSDRPYGPCRHGQTQGGSDFSFPRRQRRWRRQEQVVAAATDLEERHPDNVEPGKAVGEAQQLRPTGWGKLIFFFFADLLVGDRVEGVIAVVSLPARTHGGPLFC